MITVLILCHNQTLAEEVYNMCSYSTALMGDETLSVEKYIGDNLSVKEINNNSGVDLIFYEVGTVKDSKILCQLRARYPETEIVIIASHEVPTEYYLTLNIRPVLFLPNPCEKVKRKDLIYNLFVYLYRKRMEVESRDRLSINIEEGRRYLSYDRIICFEAFEKKIKVYYDHEQLSFYSTLKELELILPASFVRCHRSYIVNSVYIKEMNHKYNTITLENKLVIPISKKFKKKMIHQLGEMTNNSIEL